MDDHMLLLEIRTVKDLVPFVNGTMEPGGKNIIILDLKKDCFSPMSETEFAEVKRILFDPYLIAVLILNCEFTMSLYEKMYAFDLCLISENGALQFDPHHRKGLRFLHLLFAPKASLGEEIRRLSSKELLSHGLANALLRNASFYEDLESQILNLTLGRTREQLHAIKSCMNRYKECSLMGQPLMTDPETAYFCQLALLKTEEEKK
ncbi:hypothetical protein [Lacrimispora sp. JR3]|uniref:hypothetical protein n=1 Tax=Lacrimispora sinapis TaxID=3111456 RepID=UPI003747D62D